MKPLRLTKQQEAHVSHGKYGVWTRKQSMCLVNVSDVSAKYSKTLMQVAQDNAPLGSYSSWAYLPACQEICGINF